MKALALILLLIISLSMEANNPYRIYLFSKIYFSCSDYGQKAAVAMKVKPNYFIPPYEIPKGNLFCRMEDKLTRATKVWIKIGVK